jgi:hypothetical protein
MLNAGQVSDRIFKLFPPLYTESLLLPNYIFFCFIVVSQDGIWETKNCGNGQNKTLYVVATTSRCCLIWLTNGV